MPTELFPSPMHDMSYCSQDFFLQKTCPVFSSIKLVEFYLLQKNLSSYIFFKKTYPVFFLEKKLSQFFFLEKKKNLSSFSSPKPNDLPWGLGQPLAPWPAPRPHQPRQSPSLGKASGFGRRGSGTRRAGAADLYKKKWKKKWITMNLKNI